jgi:autotransporter-associated beta strand protein
LSGTGQLAAYIEEIQFGAFDHSAGINTAASLYLGSMPGSNYAANASYNLSESGQLTVSGYEVIGGLGTGIFTQTGGIHTVAGTLDISTVPPSGTASYSLSGTGVLSAQTESIALSGKGSFSQTGGTHTVTGTLALGSYSGSVGTYELSGNGQLLTGNVTIGSNSATGTFTQSGGTNRILGTLTLSSPSATYNLTGGRLIVKTLPNSSFGKFNFGGGTFMPTSSFATSQPMTFTGIGGDAKIDTRLYQLILTGSLTGEGGLKKLGENSLGLGGTNSYSGSTTVEEGTLSVPRVVSLPGYDTAGKVVVKPNGTLTVIVGASFGWTATEVYSLATNATFEDGATFGIEATSTADGGFVYDNPLAGNFSLIKLGTGSLTLTGAIDYLGTTTIASGTLCIATPASVQSNVVLHDIVGAGNLIVGDGVNPTTLTATSIHVNSLTIGSISGAATVHETLCLLGVCARLIQH